MPRASLIGVLKPVLRLALMAFLAGILSYLALGGGHGSAKAPLQHAPRVSAPVSGDWNLPKRV